LRTISFWLEMAYKRCNYKGCSVFYCLGVKGGYTLQMQENGYY